MFVCDYEDGQWKNPRTDQARGASDERACASAPPGDDRAGGRDAVDHYGEVVLTPRDDGDDVPLSSGGVDEEDMLLDCFHPELIYLHTPMQDRTIWCWSGSKMRADYSACWHKMSSGRYLRNDAPCRLVHRFDIRNENSDLT